MDAPIRNGRATAKPVRLNGAHRCETAGVTIDFDWGCAFPTASSTESKLPGVGSYILVAEGQDPIMQSMVPTGAA